MKSFRKQLEEILFKINDWNLTRDEAINQILTLIKKELPKKKDKKDSSYTFNKKNIVIESPYHRWGFNQAIDELTEKLK